MQKAMQGGNYRADVQAADWVGKVVAAVLNLDAESRGDRARISAMLKIWIASGALRRVEGFDDKRRPRQFVEVGQWAT